MQACMFMYIHAVRVAAQYSTHGNLPPSKAMKTTAMVRRTVAGAGIKAYRIGDSRIRVEYIC